MTIYNELSPTGSGGGDGDSGESVDFTDAPLEPVTQDNLDIMCLIGGRSYHIVNVEIQLTDGSSSNWAKGVIVPDGHNVLPSSNARDDDRDAEIILIEVDNELMEVREDSNGEITRIFTGVISNASRIEEGAFEFMAFHPGFNVIQNGNILISPSAPLFQASNLTDGGSGEGRTVSYAPRRLYTKEVAEQIADYIIEDTPFEATVNLRKDGWNVNGVQYGDNNRFLVSGEVVPLVSDGNSEGILERVVKASNAVWEVGRYGNFHIGPPTPDGGLPTSVTSHKLRYMTDTSAGIQSPAWNSIVVIGDGVVSQDGWGSSAQIAEDPQKFSTPIASSDVEEGVRDDLAEPVFEYTNLEISTAREAKHVLEKLRDEILKQRAGGEITVVGHPELWPGDGIELPDSERQPYGLERFAISKVTHRLNNSDGFISKIEVMGPTNAAESTFSTEVNPEDFLPDRYDTTYTDEELERVKEGRQGL